MGKKHGPYTINSSECLYRDKFIEFCVDEVIKPDGEPGRYATARMAPGVSVLALDAEGFVHLVEQFRYAVGKESIEAVGGMVDEGEEPEEAARRELREELGIEASEWTDLGLVDAVTAQASSPSRVFLARRLDFKEPQRESSEDIRSVKLKFEEAVRRVMDGEITQALTCLLILKADRLLQSSD